jgi:SynChlorMet cassette radical SAM/SPASM protein ScmF
LGLINVKLTGGEPLLHPDFMHMVDYLCEKGVRLTMETNGTLVTPEIARYLVEKSTLDFISISLDGATAVSHDAFRGVKGSFERTMRGLQNLVDVGYHPQIIMSLHTGNINEIEQLVLLVQGIGAGSVKFNLIQPTGRGETMAGRGQTLDIQRLIELGKWVEGDLQKRVLISLHYSWPIAFFGLKQLMYNNTGSCGMFNVLGALPNGHLAMCGIGMEIPELSYGQLGVDHVVDVWTSNHTLQSLRQDLPDKLEGVCAKCIFKVKCLGSCVASNYHEARRLTAPFWFCQQAYEKGLFPSKRLQDNTKVG